MDSPNIKNNIIEDTFKEQNRLKEELEELNKLIEKNQALISEFPEKYSLKIGLHSLKTRRKELLEKSVLFRDALPYIIADIVFQDYKEYRKEDYTENCKKKYTGQTLSSIVFAAQTSSNPMIC